MIKKLIKAETRLSNIALFDEEDKKYSDLLPVDEITIPSRQPRRYFDQDKMAELAESVRKYGIIEPIIVRLITNNRYELVAGERRYRAAKQIGLKDIPCVIRDLSSEEAYEIALIENLQRENLNPIEETESILQILSLKLKISEKEVILCLYKMRVAKPEDQDSELVKIATKIYELFNSLQAIKWESFVANRLPLLNLPSEILAALRQGQIEYTKARAIATVKDEQTRQQLLEETIKNNLSLLEIRDRLHALKPVSVSDSPRFLFKTITGKISKSKSLWSDPKKLKKLSALLNQLSTLVED